jgi:hypothetical protein
MARITKGVIKMIRELCIKHPLLVSKSINAQRASENYRRMYDAELVNPDSIFAEQPGESVENRMWLSNQHPVDKGFERKHEYIKDLKLFTALSYKLNKSEASMDEVMLHAIIKKDLEPREYLYPDVYGILTIKEASMILAWGAVNSPLSV